MRIAVSTSTRKPWARPQARFRRVSIRFSGSRLARVISSRIGTWINTTAPSTGASQNSTIAISGMNSRSRLLLIAVLVRKVRTRCRS